MGRKFLDSLVRRKYMNPDEMVETSLKRTLNALDLTLLGIGSTLGVGVYVLAGDVAKNTAGPSVVLSFAIAAIASVFAGFCYAEFGARVPRAGSAYIYSYVCVGEFIAFIIGWTLILEYMIGTASVARGYSNYLDALFNKKMQAAFHEITPIHEWIDNPTVAEYLSPYLDFFAFAICVFLTLLLCFGVKESSKFNSVFTCLNLLVVVYVVIIGSINAKVKNWQIKPEEVQNPGNKLDIGDGGFFPFGINGMLSGAATCFYGFIGFDCVATTGEETKNPQRAIPIAIVVSLTFIFLAYFGVSTVLTMMWPYYDQDPYSPLPTVFEAIGWSSAKWVVSIGALFGLSTSLLGTMFPLPRVVYAMANDGLIFRCFSKVNARFKTPVIATLVSGTCGGILAAIFELSSLVDMMSIGTLLAYTLVAMCVLILRYEKEGSSFERKTDFTLEDSHLNGPFSKSDILKQLFNLPRLASPNSLSSKIATFCSFFMGVCFIGVNGILIFQEDSISGKSDAKWPIVLLVIFILMSLITVVIISRQPMNKHKLHFKVPLVPFLPAVSIWINIYLMMKLSDKTWIRFSVWMILGILMYFLYGIRHSNEAKKRDDIDESQQPGETAGDSNVIEGAENDVTLADGNDAKLGEIKGPESLNVGSMNKEDNDRDKQTSTFKALRKSAVIGLQMLQSNQHKNDGISDEPPKNIKLTLLPELNVNETRMLSQEVMTGRGQGKRKLGVKLSEERSRTFVRPKETTVDNLMLRHISDFINHRNDETSGDWERLQPLDVIREEDQEGHIIDLNSRHSAKSGVGFSVSRDEAEVLSKWISGIHSKISGPESGNSYSDLAYNLWSLHLAMDKSINELNLESFLQNEKLSMQIPISLPSG